MAPLPAPGAAPLPRRTIQVQTEDFDPGQAITALTTGDAGAGGLALFIGSVRDFAADSTVSAMTLEHYPGMTERQLTAIVDTAASRWPLRAVTVIHRVGRLLPGDRIVLVACTSAHRDAAFDACRFIMDWLKTKAPFWKLEERPDGAHWVAAKESDSQAAARWTTPVA